MLRKIETPFILVLVYILLLLFLAGDDILQATYSIAEQVRTSEDSYRVANDALEAIRLDINKIATAARDGIQSQRPGDARGAVTESEREIETQIRLLRKVAAADSVAYIQPIEDEVHTYLKDVDSVTDQAFSADSRIRLDNVLESRQSIVNLAAAFSKWNDSNFETDQKAIGLSLGNLRTEIITILALIGLLGAAAGGAALYRIIGIEKSNQQAHAKGHQGSGWS